MCKSTFGGKRGVCDKGKNSYSIQLCWQTSLKKESLSKHRLGLIPGPLWANITTKKTKMSKTQISSPTQHITQLRIVCPPAFPKHNSITYSVSHRNHIKHRRHLVHSVTLLGSAPTVHMDSPLCTYYFPNSVTHVESVYFTG